LKARPLKYLTGGLLGRRISVVLYTWTNYFLAAVQNRTDIPPPRHLMSALGGKADMTRTWDDDSKRTCTLPEKRGRNSIFPASAHCPEVLVQLLDKWAEKSPSVGGRGYECPAADDVSVGRPLC
jgi:hypothetical protein